MQKALKEKDEELKKKDEEHEKELEKIQKALEERDDEMQKELEKFENIMDEARGIYPLFYKEYLWPWNNIGEKLGLYFQDIIFSYCNECVLWEFITMVESFKPRNKREDEYKKSEKWLRGILSQRKCFNMEFMIDPEKDKISPYYVAEWDKSKK